MDEFSIFDAPPSSLTLIKEKPLGINWKEPNIKQLLQPTPPDKTLFRAGEFDYAVHTYNEKKKREHHQHQLEIQQQQQQQQQKQREEELLKQKQAKEIANSKRSTTPSQQHPHIIGETPTTTTVVAASPSPQPHHQQHQHEQIDSVSPASSSRVSKSIALLSKGYQRPGARGTDNNSARSNTRSQSPKQSPIPTARLLHKGVMPPEAEVILAGVHSFAVDSARNVEEFEHHAQDVIRRDPRSTSPLREVLTEFEEKEKEKQEHLHHLHQHQHQQPHSPTTSKQQQQKNKKKVSPVKQQSASTPRKRTPSSKKTKKQKKLDDNDDTSSNGSGGGSNGSKSNSSDSEEDEQELIPGIVLARSKLPPFAEARVPLDPFADAAFALTSGTVGRAKLLRVAVASSQQQDGSNNTSNNKQMKSNTARGKRYSVTTLSKQHAISQLSNKNTIIENAKKGGGSQTARNINTIIDSNTIIDNSTGVATSKHQHQIFAGQLRSSGVDADLERKRLEKALKDQKKRHIDQMILSRLAPEERERKLVHREKLNKFRLVGDRQLPFPDVAAEDRYLMTKKKVAPLVAQGIQEIDIIMKKWRPVSPVSTGRGGNTFTSDNNNNNNDSPLLISGLQASAGFSGAPTSPRHGAGAAAHGSESARRGLFPTGKHENDKIKKAQNRVDEQERQFVEKATKLENRITARQNKADKKLHSS